jgi:CheY-like chemotaxis protein
MQPTRLALLIEDDRDIAESAALRLAGAGFQTQIAGSAEDGLALAERLCPHVIILDIRLPKMDGLTALRKLKSDARTQEIPVIALSASVVDQRSALEEGARFYLKKPYEACELLRAVEMAVGDSPDQHPSAGNARRSPLGDTYHDRGKQPAGSPLRAADSADQKIARRPG